MYGVKFNFFIGDTYNRNFNIKKYSDPISEIYFTVKKNNSDKNFVLQKTLDNGITLCDVVYEDDKIVKRTYNILISPSDTESMKPEVEYPFDVEIITPVTNGEDIHQTIITGNCILTNATTRAYNEGE